MYNWTQWLFAPLDGVSSTGVQNLFFNQAQYSFLVWMPWCHNSSVFLILIYINIVFACNFLFWIGKNFSSFLKRKLFSPLHILILFLNMFLTWYHFWIWFFSIGLYLNSLWEKDNKPSNGTLHDIALKHSITFSPYQHTFQTPNYK